MKLPTGTEKEFSGLAPVGLSPSFIAMANATSVLLWVSNRANEYVYINDWYLGFLGVSREEYRKELFFDAIHPDDQKQLFKNFNTCFKSKKAFKMEYRLRRHDGQYRWVLDSGVPHFGEDHQFAGYIGSCVDVHEIKELEQRKAQFITAASHELKTPVTSLTVYLHLIDEYFRTNHIEPFEEYSKGAVLQLNKITALISQLVDLSRIHEGSLNFDWTTFSFEKLVREQLERMKLGAPKRILNLSGKSKGKVSADYDRLGQAISNLISNGLKYSEEDQPIEIFLDEDEKTVSVCITDYGIGISEKYIFKIFERFFRIPGKKEETYPGLGIGLFLTERIIQRLKGKLFAESKEGEFTKFTIILPKAKNS